MMVAKYTVTVTAFDLPRLVSIVDLTANVVHACKLYTFAIQVVNVTLICVFSYYTFSKLEFLRCNNDSLYCLLERKMGFNLRVNCKHSLFNRVLYDSLHFTIGAYMYKM